MIRPSFGNGTFFGLSTLILEWCMPRRWLWFRHILYHFAYTSVEFVTTSIYSFKKLRTLNAVQKKCFNKSQITFARPYGFKSRHSSKFNSCFLIFSINRCTDTTLCFGRLFYKKIHCASGQNLNLCMYKNDNLHISRIFDLVADINSGIIFSLLPINVLFLALTMYGIEFVSIWKITIFIERKFCWISSSFIGFFFKLPL